MTTRNNGRVGSCSFTVVDRAATAAAALLETELLMQPPRHDDLHEVLGYGPVTATQGSFYTRQSCQPLLRG